MEIKILTSSKMDAISAIDSRENRVIRMTEACRNEHNLKIGEFVCLRRRTGEIMSLQVQEAYHIDASKDATCAYTTTSINERLFIRNRNQSELLVVDNITLGCDPEAILIDRTNGQAMAACRFMQKQGEVGNDGLLLEFRPPPSTNAEDVCRSLWRLIQQGRAILNRYQEGQRAMIWGGSAYGNITAGFHLHYGIPQRLLSSRRDNKRIAQLMTVAFDYYVGIPSIIPEGNEDVGRRTIKFMNYGKPGGYRINNRTFEFRLPGGTNLKHPRLSIGLMSLGAVVAEDVLSRINTCTDCFSNLSEMSTSADIGALYPHLPSAQVFYEVICNPDITLARRHFETIKTDVRGMVGYAKRAAAVEEYFYILENKINFSNDIEQNWGGFYGKEQKMVFLSSTS